MQKKRQTVALLLVMVLWLLAACAPGGASPQNVEPQAESENAGESVATLRIAVVANPVIEDITTNEFTKWYETQTGVHVEWEVVPSTGAEEKLNLMLASGDLPDVLMDFPVTPAQLMIYGEQGIFVELNDLIANYGVETQAMFKSSPQVEDLITAPNGKIYALPQVNECYHCSLAQKMWIYKPWLDKLGLDVPTTTEEFYQVLKAFKEQDPNGNGIADEIPLAGALNGWHTNIDGFLMNPFILSNPFNNASRLVLENGRIRAAFTTNEWKQGLAYLHRLAAEGLLSNQSFVQDSNQLKQLGENPDVPILGAAPAGGPNVFTQVYGESGRWLEYVPVPPLVGPSGQRITPYSPFGVNIGRYIITRSAKDPVTAFRWADGLYNREVTLRSVFGVPGVHWRWAEEGEIGLNGEPAIWNRDKTFGQVQNFAWAQTGPSYRPNALRLGEVADNPEENLEVILYKATKNYYEPYAQPMDTIIPPLYFTADQSAELADLSLTIGDYVDEMTARFITGDADIEQEWDTYLNTLDAMGLWRYIEIYQAAYDAKYAQ